MHLRIPFLAVSLLAFSLVAASATAVSADTPGEHGHYLHALSDLRYARALLFRPDEPNVKWEERRAIVEIDQAIGECRRAAIDDGKNLADHPPVDANLSHADRLRRALRSLDAAHRDLAYEEDNAAAWGWRARAIGDIHDAIGFTRHAIGADAYDDAR
ncbi:MAG: hypothetical protein JO359_15685 [Candidatus Eremiobacteraeota bacterium]|nr:hypothetical protein [Candidatus Eremiobacteraeota bacterium]